MANAIIRKKGNIKYALSGDDSFIATVSDGETFASNVRSTSMTV